MNIFYLDVNPKIAAQLQCDKHVIKMAVETAQMLSTAHRELSGIECNYDKITFGWKDTTEECKKTKKIKLLNKFDEKNNNEHATVQIYRSAHKNHPSTKWVRENSSNYLWAYRHLEALLKEYKFRFDKTHASEKIMKYLSFIPENIFHGCQTNIPLCMPDEYKSSDSVKSYQSYYNSKDFDMKWTKRITPKFKKEN